MIVNTSFSLIDSKIISKLKEKSITTPTKVQEKVIPTIIEGKNILFQSETGTGKTFAYLLPLITSIENNENINKSIKLLIISPTLELASQIRDAVKSITDKKCTLLIGGAPIKRQVEMLKEKSEIVIGNISRLLELTKLKKLKLANLSAVVFDEVDRLVKKEIKDELLELIAHIPKQTQFIGCSATITKNTKDFFNNLEVIIMPEEQILRKKITHWAIYSETRDKIDTLRKLLLLIKGAKVLIFTSRTEQVENIATKLKYKNIDCVALHSKEDKQTRKAAIDKFKNNKCNILITSDVASRGLDIENIAYVIQMDLYEDDNFFIHRAGRTARSGKNGINIVIGDEYEMRLYSALEKRQKIIVYPKIIYNKKIISPDKIN